MYLRRWWLLTAYSIIHCFTASLTSTAIHYEGMWTIEKIMEKKNMIDSLDFSRVT